VPDPNPFDTGVDRVRYRWTQCWDVMLRGAFAALHSGGYSSEQIVRRQSAGTRDRPDSDTVLRPVERCHGNRLPRMMTIKAKWPKTCLVRPERILATPTKQQVAVSGHPCHLVAYCPQTWRMTPGGDGRRQKVHAVSCTTAGFPLTLCIRGAAVRNCGPEPPRTTGLDVIYQRGTATAATSTSA